MHALYIGLLVYGLLTAECTTESTFPLVFYLKEALFILYFIILLVLWHKQFLIDWKDPGQRQIKRKEFERNSPRKLQ